MDIRPRKRPVSDASKRPFSTPVTGSATSTPPQPTSQPVAPSEPMKETRLVGQNPVSAPLPITTRLLTPGRKGLSPRKKIWIALVSFVAFVIVVALSGWFWYQSQLTPVDTNSSELVRINVVLGSSPDQIGEQLKDEGLIRNEQAFRLYTRITKTQNLLQAGAYRLSPSMTTPEIVGHLTNGIVDTFSVQFLPGATLAENKKVFIEAGYSEAEIDEAFAASYDSPLFEGRPVTSDLEGYIYGETYAFASDTSVRDILEHIFAHYTDIVKENDLISQYRAQGLTLYEGITLASIIQREAVKGDEPQIAQVFFSRLEQGIELGSDVTYQYIADKTGVPRDTNLDSPYNTRRYPGLPPGPIAAPGLASLLAVADPAPGDYLYFLSGDDDITYYGRTLREHEANIAAHCVKKCSIL